MAQQRANMLYCDGRMIGGCEYGTVAWQLAILDSSLNMAGLSRRVETLVLSLLSVARLCYFWVDQWDPSTVWVRVEKSLNLCLAHSMLTQPLKSLWAPAFVPVAQQAIHSR